MEILQLIVLGLSVGFISSFFGIGGGSIIVPVIYMLYPNLPSTIVIPISLGTIFVVTLINTFKFAKKKLLPPKKIILNFLVSCSIGGLLGAQILYMVNTDVAKKIIGIILVIMIIKLLVFKTKDNPAENFKPTNLPFSLTGFFGAFISSVTGLGGGIIFTPIFINILRVPLKLVSPFSNLAMVIATFIGAVPHLFHQHNEVFFKTDFMNQGFIGNVNLIFIAIIAFGAFFSSSLGVKYNSIVEPKKKKALLIIILLIFSLKMLI